MSANDVPSNETLLGKFMESIQPLMRRMMEEFMAKQGAGKADSPKANEVGVNGDEQSTPVNQGGSAMSMQSSPTAAAAAETAAALQQSPRPTVELDSPNNKSTEHITAKNDVELEKLKLDASGFSYRKVRAPREVTRIHPGIKSESVLSKFKGLKTWERIDLNCSSSAHPTQPCEATLVIDRHIDTHEILAVTMAKEHRKDHPNQKRKRPDADVIKKAKKLLATGKTPAQAEEELMQSAQEEEGPGAPLTPNRAPLKAQLSRMATYERRKANPFANSEVLQNVHARFGPHLICGATIPSVRFIYMSEWQREYARSRKAKVLSLDCTFRCVVGDLLLTVLLCQAPAPHYRVWFPLAFCIHESESEEDISSLLHEIQKKASVKPEIVLGDFSHAIQNAVRKEMPTATYYADTFHLLHDNRKWLVRNGVAKEECNAIVKELRGVVMCRSSIELPRRLAAFKEKWREMHANYIEYFVRTWEGRAEQWCLSSRPPDVPTGDQIHVAYHRRLKKHVFRGRLKIDLVSILVFIHKEADHWKSIALSEDLLSQLSRDINQRANTRAEPLREPRPRAPAPTDTAVQLVADSDEEEDPAAEDFSSRVELGQEAAVEPPPAGDIAAPVRSLLRIGGHCPGANGVRCISKKKQISQQCTKKLCASCCAHTYGECRVTGHNKARHKLLLLPMIERLTIAADRALTSRDKELWICYKKEGSDFTRVHMIHDVRWEDDQKKYFHARLLSQRTDDEVDPTFKVGRLYGVSFTVI